MMTLEDNLLGNDIPQGKIIQLQRAVAQLRESQPYRVRGKVTELTGLIIKASVPGVRVGEMCFVTSPKDEGAPLKSEVVGFKDGNVFLMPLGEARGIGPDSEVIPTGKPFSIKCGYSLLGRTLDGIGDPIDGGTSLMNWLISKSGQLKEIALIRIPDNPSIVPLRWVCAP